MADFSALQGIGRAYGTALAAATIVGGGALAAYAQIMREYSATSLTPKQAEETTEPPSPAPPAERSRFPDDTWDTRAIHTAAWQGRKPVV